MSDEISDCPLAFGASHIFWGFFLLHFGCCPPLRKMQEAVARDARAWLLVLGMLSLPQPARPCAADLPQTGWTPRCVQAALGAAPGTAD